MSPVTVTQTIMNLETVTATMAVTQLVTDLKTVTSTMAVTELVTSLKNVTATMPVTQLVTDVKTITATSVVDQVQMVTVTIPGTCTLTLTRAVFSACYGYDEQNYNNYANNFYHVNKGHEYHLNDYDKTNFYIIGNASEHRVNSNSSLSPPRNWHTTGKRSLRYVNDGNDNDNDVSADDDNHDDESYLGTVLNFDNYQTSKQYIYHDYHVQTHDYNVYDILYNGQADDDDFDDDLDVDKTNNNINDDLNIDQTNDHVTDDYLNDDAFKLY
ncbi:hypothetical protein MMC15_005645 [Xylographa vitiligo]|nr:hypothetical protein [Xylographa vitiligo]